MNAFFQRSCVQLCGEHAEQSPDIVGCFFLCENARVISSDKKKKFNQALFRWHKSNYREMAWRNTRNPYRILISEIMLQQTQVERVRTKYAEFLKNFPNVNALANASLGDVLRVWSGLGYNRRAKYLHECSKIVVKEYGGTFPHDISAMKTLPGIGISTSAALAAFAFGADEPMIDTNIRRILTRVFFNQNLSRFNLDKFGGKLREGVGDNNLYLFAKTLIPSGKGREWNYAMLDLGATLCTARSHSDDCPLQKLHGKVENFVYKKPQKKFAGSRRYYRGQIMKLLITHGFSLHRLATALALPSHDVEAILSDLVGEKLIVRKGSSFSLS